MHSFTTTVCAILTDLRATIARIAPRERARTLFLNLLWGRLSHTAQLFDLFERLLAEWRNGTLPDAAALCPPPSAVPAATRASSPKRACPPPAASQSQSLIAATPRANPIRRKPGIPITGSSAQPQPHLPAKPPSTATLSPKIFPPPDHPIPARPYHSVLTTIPPQPSNG